MGDCEGQHRLYMEKGEYLKEGQIPQSQAFQSLIFIANDGSLGKNYEEICSSVKNLVANLAIKYF